MARPLSSIQIQDLIRRHTTARYRRLDQLERFVAGTQYEGRPDWFDDSVELFRRAPCVVYPIVRTAIGSHVGMIFRKPPVITSAPDEDESTIDPEFGLDEETSKKLDAGIVQVCKHASLFATLDRLLSDAMGAGSAVAIPAIRNGRLAVDVTNSKWCEPTFSSKDHRKVERLEIKYPFLQDKQDPVSRRWFKAVMLYRRVIDPVSDTTFEPVEAPESELIEPQWKPQKVVDHNLGFCPVVWYKFMGQCAPIHENDGHAVHATILDEVQAMDFSRSQRHRAVLYNADPITYETGVMEGYAPTETVTGGAYMGPEDARENRDWRTASQARRMGRQRGPGKVWQYPNESAKVGLLTLPSDSVEACNKNIGDLERVICETLHWDPIDPKEMKSGATLSGRALEMLYTRQVTFCNKVRADFAEGALLPVVDMLLRMLVLMRKRNERIYVPGFEAITDVLADFQDDKRPSDESWMSPRLSVQWPGYFEPNDADKKVVSDMVRADIKDGVIKRETGIAALARAGVYQIENPAQYAEDMEKEAEEKAESLRQAQMALAEAAGKAPPGGPPAPPKPGKAPRPVTQNGKRKKGPMAKPAAPTLN